MLLLPFAADGAGLPTVRGADRAREVGHPFLRNYTPREFRTQPQILAAAQDARGLMYFGTRAGVIEYDGISWTVIPVGGPTSETKGLATDPATGTVYVGATDELGYLQPVPGGKTVFVSLRDRLPAEARGFNVNRIFATPGGICFISGRRVMRWHRGRFDVLDLPSRPMLSACVDGRLYFKYPPAGLLRLEGNTFVPASDDPVFREDYVTAMTAGPDGSLLVGTHKHGLYTLRDGRTVPLPGETNEIFKTKLITSCRRLRDGSLAVGTAFAGVILLDKDNRFCNRWDENSGLQDVSVIDLFEDREGGVWLCLENGMTRVEAASPLSVFDTGNGLKRESIQDFIRLDGTAIIGTTTGLYRIVEADPATARPARCERLPGIDGNFINFCAVDAGLLIASQQGVFQLDRQLRLTPVLPASAAPICLERSRAQPGRVFLGTAHGLRSLLLDPASGRWTDEGLIDGLRGPDGVEAQVRSLVEDARGDLWVGTYSDGLFRVRLAAAASEDAPTRKRGAATVTPFLNQPGPLAKEAWAQVVRWKGGAALVLTYGGLYRAEEGGGMASVPDYGRRFTDGSFRVESYAADTEDCLWLVGRAAGGIWLEQEAGRAVPAARGAAAAFQRLPHKVSDKLEDVQGFAAEPGGVVWTVGPGGMVRVDTRRWVPDAPQAAPGTLIRNASTTNTAGAGARAEPILAAPLPYARNSTHFDFAADTFALGADVRYQTRLAGFEGGKWSDFSERTAADYTNLPEGGYVFEVRARDADGRLGGAASLPFRILPPLHRTPWAYALYTLGLAAGVCGIVRWQLRRLRLQNARLEGLVAARTGELRAHQAELVRAKDEAEAANRAKSAFLANMSHELRTPLNAILGYTQILLKDAGLSPKNRERLSVVGQSGGHLLAMINEVLDLSKIEAGRLTLLPVDFSLAQLLDDMGAVFRLRLAEKGLVFRCERGAGVPDFVQGDAGKLRQVLFNLLGNAVKFTRRGEVRLDVSTSGPERVRFEIADTGIGIPESELRNIFVAFHQAGNSVLAAQGTGLGLAISQRLVELLGGRLEVASTPEKGSRFWFETHLPPAAARAPTGGGAGGPALMESALLGPRAVIGFRGPPRRVLIVDDEPAVRWVLRELLQPLGFEIEEAIDGDECLALCARRAPDALLLDLRMDRRNGFEVARLLRQQGGESQAVRIVAVSASVFETDRQGAINAGCDEFLPKPFKEDQLLAVLGRVLALEWVYAVTPPHPAIPARDGEDGAGEAGGTGAEEAPPPREEIDAILELSRRGDILGIKKRLGALAAANGAGGYPAFVRGLEPLVAGYQMDRIREVLIRFQGNAKD